MHDFQKKNTLAKYLGWFLIYIFKGKTLTAVLHIRLPIKFNCMIALVNKSQTELSFSRKITFNAIMCLIK